VNFDDVPLVLEEKAEPIEQASQPEDKDNEMDMDDDVIVLQEDVDLMDLEKPPDPPKIQKEKTPKIQEEKTSAEVHKVIRHPLLK